MKTLNEKQAILLDWDDNVVKTHEEIFGLYESFARRYQLAVPSPTAIKAFWGRPLRGMLSGLWPEENLDYLEQSFVNSVPQDHVVAPFPGAEEALEKLAKTHLLGVVSSTPKKGLENTMRKFPRLSAINYVHFQAGEDCSYHKPDPRVFDEALIKLDRVGIGKAETMYVGDALVDFEAAKSCGLLFVAVSTGFTTKEEFLNAGLDQDKIIENFGQLPSKLIRDEER